MSRRAHISLQTKLAALERELALARLRIAQLEGELERRRLSHAKGRAAIAGKKFSRLLVLGVGKYKEHPSGRRTFLWRCQCDCGRTSYVSSQSLKSGLVRSCGCLKKELDGSHARTHGMTATPTYRSWASMIARCTNPRLEHYPDYGGRGIKVCDRWRESFEAFLADVGERPSLRHQIDREDNDGNYEPGNCRWATRKVNTNNRRNTAFITLDGVRLPLQSWAERLGISARTLRSRRRLGWSDRAILTTGVNQFRGPDSGRPL